MKLQSLSALVFSLALCLPLQAQKLDIIDVEGQPLAANATRLVQALEFLGHPLPADVAKPLDEAIKARDVKKIQQILDPLVLVQVSLNPESRVKAARGPGQAALQQGGYTPVLIKVANDSTVTKTLRVSSPQAGAIFSGGRAGNTKPDKARFLDLEMYLKQPMTAMLSGLKCEYALALIHSSEAGKREATLGFDVGQGTQDVGFRGEVPILFEIKPAIPVKLTIKDTDGKPTVGRFTFKDKLGRVYPPQPKRLAPDFFFQEQVYRPDGGTVLLPPGELVMDYGRGPEYKQLTRKVTIPEKGDASIEVKLERWINTMDFGFYSGDHHIHAAGCAHYTNPTEGVHAEDMFLHVKGEGLNVGCNLTWGPCFDYQIKFNQAAPHKLSEPFTVLKYDIEVSGFGSQALGHVCLLNLKEHNYPGSDGLSTKGWPTWTTPLMRWAKKQGAVTGYAHSASGLAVNPQQAAGRLIRQLDANNDGKLTEVEAGRGLLPEAFGRIDADKDGFITEAELVQSHTRVMNVLPNLAIPQMDGIGAQEVCVTTAMGLCDFISAMDTNRTQEWNCWYHVMNCGFPLKASGETDFPCISGSRVGEGRVYVQLGKQDKVDYTAWCEGIRQGKTYVSDGYAHALTFTVNGKSSGEQADLPAAGKALVKAKVAFANEVPLGTAKGGQIPQPRDKRLVELIVNGQVAAKQEVPADDQPHDLIFDVNIDKSSWVALRSYPQLHTNPVNVIVAGKPIRASRSSAQWCQGTIEQLWRVRGAGIKAEERDEAKKTFEQAIEIYKKIAGEAAAGS